MITREFVARFKTLAEAANASVRLVDVKFYQRTSALEPLYRLLSGAIGQDRTWDQIKDTIRAIPLEKQRKYATALKYVQKQVQGHGDHMFASLKLLGTKLSKAQQRYLIPMLSADGEVTEEQRTYAGGGLCFNLTLDWLKERFASVPYTVADRMADSNVMASAASYEGAKRAAAAVNAQNDIPGTAKGLGMVATRTMGSTTSFDSCETYFANPNNARLRATLMTFRVSDAGGNHAVALFRESATRIQFFDSNVGSYSVAADHLRNFLLSYNNVCLPLKWPGYAAIATRPFESFYRVSKT